MSRLGAATSRWRSAVQCSFALNGALHKSRIKLFEARLEYSSEPAKPRGAEMVRIFRLLSATVGMLAFVSVSAESADDLTPPVGYRQWFHVNTMIVDKSSPLFEVLGGMHNVHVNSVGESALRKGEPYPDGTVFLTDLHDFSVVDGSYVEGTLKGLALMAKDSKKYASTGGWGFEFWVGGDPKKPVVTDATKQCFECHQPKKDQDYVYSTYIP
jgi:hypothetical protein